MEVKELRYMKNNLYKWTCFCVLLTILLLLLLCIIITIIASPYKYDEIVASKYEVPSINHIFGADYLGRDIFIRLCVAVLVSISIAVSAIVAGGLLGSVYGIFAGYIGGKIENILISIIDIIQCMPDILVAIFIMVVANAAKFSNSIGSILGLMATLSIITWPIMARTAKNETKVIRQMEFVTYSKIKGARPSHIIFKHILPNVKNKLASVMAQRIPKIIIIESFLSYIGIGVQAPFPSLGKMINDGVMVIRIAPHVLVFPIISLILIVMLFNLFCICIQAER